jgi:phosphohistidine swiveling domain-containing protein
MLDFPILTRADGAMNLLTDGQMVTLDPQKGIVYKGSVTSDDEMIPTICSPS